MTDRSEQSGQRRLDPKLLEILVCPLTKTTLAYDAERQELISRAAGLAYPIRDGIPDHAARGSAQARSELRRLASSAAAAAFRSRRRLRSPESA